MSLKQSKEIKMSTLQKVITIKMTESKTTIPHFYMSIDIDVEAIGKAKDILAKNIPEKKITYTPLLMKLVAETLKDYPMLNASVLPEYKIELHNYINMGVAVSTERGLIVPVIKDIGCKKLEQIVDEFTVLIGRAREGCSRREDLSGGTFTLSNAGMFGIKEFYSIIKPPEAAILTIGGIRRCPVVYEESIIPRSIMTVTISVDHRAADGVNAAKFLSELRFLFESKNRLKEVLNF